jgi:hypothetical protein
MFFPSATVVAAVVLVLAGATPLEARTAARGTGTSNVSAAPKRVGGLWAPKKSSKPRAPKADDDDAREEELLRSKSTPAGDAAPRKRRPIKMDESAQGQGDEEEDEGAEEDEDDEDRPKVTKRRKRVVEEEEEDAAPEPISSQPSVIPRVINFGVGMAGMRRSFAYDQAAQQGDKGFRLGYQLALESYPFVNQPNGAWRTIGIGAFYEKEYGDATWSSPSSGQFVGYGFNQSRWGFDARWAIPAGDWVIIAPALGYGRLGADLKRMTPTAPSSCGATVMEPCFADVNASYLSADVHLRFGVTTTFALSLSGGYLLGLGVQRGMDQIAAEASATMRGFHVDAGAQLLIGDYFAVQAAIPFRRYSFAFDAPTGSTFMYRAATDMYFGLIAGVAVLTK